MIKEPEKARCLTKGRGKSRCHTSLSKKMILKWMQKVTYGDAQSTSSIPPAPDEYILDEEGALGLGPTGWGKVKPFLNDAITAGWVAAGC